ncbi:MAG: hypothetical protein EA370_05895 [Wenzhouxiangella sp.]|nr:MAG: hypothetical protein EA370_05895 [Wenzhouxiangella sp.]
MQAKVKDKLPILVRGRNMRKLLLAFLASVVLAACAAGPHNSENQTQQPADTTQETAIQDSDSDVTNVLAEGGLDADLLFHVLAAERLGRVGDFEAAMEHQLEAARLGDDPDLARQVVSLALALDDWSALVDGAMRWQELAPGERSPGRFLALGLLNLGEPEQAAAVLGQQIAGSSEPEAAWREATMLLAAAERSEDAMAAMDSLLSDAELDADSALALENRSLLLWQLERTEEALALALQAAEQGRSVRRWVWAAQLAAAADDLDLALSHYRRAREIDPDEVALALSEVEVLRQLDRLEEAVAELQRLPESSELLYTLGSYQYQLGQTEAARATWGRLAALDQIDDPMHHAFLTGFLAELLDMGEQALGWYEKVESGPRADRARLRRAIIEGDRGNLMVARNLLRSVRLAGGMELTEQAWLIEADLLRVAGRPDEAVELLTIALRERPDSVALLYTRGICAVAMDDLELAEQDFRRILQIDDDNAMALNALGYTLTDRTDRHQEAYRLIRRALALEPDSPAILDSMGWVYFRLGQPEQALPYLEQALAGEDNPEIAAHVGEVLWVLERQSEATEVLLDALERFPEDDYLLDTLRRLGLLE